jgi:YesN/AraC family two-component response regulator
MSASNGEKGHKLYKEELPDIILTDIQMPNGDGLNLIKQIRTNDTKTPIILLTSFVEQEVLFNTESLSINAEILVSV